MPARLPPETALLLAELRAERPSALRKLRAALRRNAGNVRDTAAELGLSERTLHRLREVPAVRDVLESHGMGREGAAKVALDARQDDEDK